MELKTSSISSNDMFAVSGTKYVDQRYAAKHATAKVMNVPLLYRWDMSERGVIREGIAYDGE